MKARMLSVICLLLLASLAHGQTVASPRETASQKAAFVESYGRLPLALESNQEQADYQVKFLSRGAGYTLFLTPTDAVLALSEGSEQPAANASMTPPSQGARGQALNAAKDRISPPTKSAVLRMKLVSANTQAEVIGQDELLGMSNYFIGNEPKKWHTNVQQFAKVRYENVYPGVDLVYHGHQRELEYDFVLPPGADPQRKQATN